MAQNNNSGPGLSLFKKVIFSGAILLGFLVLLETAGQIAGIFAKSRGPELRPDAKVIVCIGDSHTYGIYLPREDAYPAQLEKLLNKKGGGYQVVNLGAPGQNSTQILSALPEIFRDYKPYALVILVGVNNGWNIAGQEKNLPQKMLNRSKIYKLCRLLYFHYFQTEKSFIVAKRRDSPERLYNIERADQPKDTAGLRDIQMLYLQDMSQIISLCRKSQVKVVLMNYGGDKVYDYHIPNLMLDQVAEKMEVPMVDNYSYFMSRLYSPDGVLDKDLHQQIFFADNHLKTLGYTWVADNLYPVLQKEGIAE